LSGEGLQDAVLSPNGRWLAFVSDESGNGEIYIQSFPEPTGRWMVSNGGQSGEASSPIWSPAGRELFYRRGGTITVVSVTADPSLSFGQPKTLFNVSFTSTNTNYAIGNDSQRILVNELPPTAQNMIGARLIQNWVSALNR